MTQISTKWLENDAVTPDKLDATANFTMNKLTTTSDATISGDLKIIGNISGGSSGTSTFYDVTITNNTILNQARATDFTSTHDLYVGNDSTIGSDLDVNRDLWVGQDATVIRDFYAGGSLTVDVNVSIGQDASITGNLRVGQDSTIDGGLQVMGSSEIQENLNVIGDFRAGGDTTLQANLWLSGMGHFVQDLWVGQDETVIRNLKVGNDASVGYNLWVGNDASVARDLLVGNDVEADGTVNAAKLYAPTGEFNYLSVNNNLTTYDVTGEYLYSIEDIKADRDASVARNLWVGNDASVARDLLVGNDVEADGTVNAAKLYAPTGEFNYLSVNNNLTTYDVTGGYLYSIEDIKADRDASVARNLWVGNDTSVVRNLWVGQDASVTRNLLVGRDATVNNLRVLGSFNASVAGGDFTCTSLKVLSDASVIGKVSCGSLRINYSDSTHLDVDVSLGDYYDDPPNPADVVSANLNWRRVEDIVTVTLGYTYTPDGKGTLWRIRCLSDFPAEILRDTLEPKCVCSVSVFDEITAGVLNTGYIVPPDAVNGYFYIYPRSGAWTEGEIRGCDDVTITYIGKPLT